MFLKKFLCMSSKELNSKTSLKNMNVHEIKENAELYCRVKGYKCRIRNQQNDKLRISSSNIDAYETLGMEVIERGIYEKWISSSEVDCIYKVVTNESVSSKEIEVLTGSLKVTAKEVPYTHNNYNTDFCKNFGFAIHKGKKFLNYDGYNNDYLYFLGSFDIDSQEDGFIMEAPGWFTKTVSPQDIEVAFNSKTWCTYKGYKFIVAEGELNTIKIEPYSRGDYSEDLLKSLGFYIENTKWVKQLTIDEVTNLWVINIPWAKFQHIQMLPDIIKGIIMEG